MMVYHTTLLTTLLLACTAIANPLPAAAPAIEDTSLAARDTNARAEKVPYFILIGDSTTAPVQAWSGSKPPGGGGWGDGFLATLKDGASGINLGKNGQTTVSYRANGWWKEVLAKIAEKSATNTIWATCQFGHNDQKPEKGINITTYEKNLEKMVLELRSLKVNVILVTPLTRRSFDKGVITNSLDNEAIRTKEAAANTKAVVIDLNAASKKYVQAIGPAEATKLDADYRGAQDASTAKDNTHLNAHGSAIFGRMVADLIYRQVPALGYFIKSDRPLSAAIAAGDPY